MKARHSTLFATVMILIASSASAARWVVPAAAHSVGSGGTNWRTDLRIVNSDASVAAVRLYLLPAATDNGGLDRSTDLTVPAGGQVQIADVLESRFSFAGTAALLVESDSDGLVVTSRTYNLVPGGTYGQFIPGISTRHALQPGETGHLVGLAKSSDQRSNLGFAGVSGTPATVSVTLVDRDGHNLGSGTFALPEFGQHQVNDVFAAVGAPPAAAARAIVTSTAPMVAYASVVDNRTGDPVALIARRAPAAAADLQLPAAARSAGVGSSLWRSDLRVLNTGDRAGEVTLAYHPKGMPVTDPARVTLPIGSGEMLVLDDVMASAFGLDTANGGLRVVADVPLLVTSRTYNQSDQGTFGQSIPAAAAADLLVAGDLALFSGISGGGFRSNAGFFNVGSVSTELSLEIVDGDGRVVGTGTTTLGAGEMEQINDVLSALGVPGDGPFTLRVSAPSGGPYAAFVSVIDNLSNDPVYEGATVKRAGAGGGVGVCVELSSPRSGLRVDYTLTSEFEGEVVERDTEATFVSTTPAGSTTHTRSSFTADGVEIVQEVEVEELWTILDTPPGHLALEGTDMSTTTSALGTSTTSITEERFSPRWQLGPFTRRCANETWITESVTSTQQVAGRPAMSRPTAAWSGVVEAVSESLTVSAGTFEVVRTKTTFLSGEDAGASTRVWNSIEHGVMLRQETYDPSGTLVGHREATRIE